MFQGPEFVKMTIPTRRLLTFTASTNVVGVLSSPEDSSFAPKKYFDFYIFFVKTKEFKSLKVILTALSY